LLIEDDGVRWDRSTGDVFRSDDSAKDAAYDDLPVAEIIKLAETGGAFDFLADPEEDIYTDDDLKVRYK